MHLSSWSPDGEWLVFDELPQQDIWALNVNDTEQLIPVATDAEAQEAHAQFSPDGNWLAYTSSESGKGDIFIVSFPDTSIKRQISTNGGFGPRWSRNSQLFYWSGDALMGVTIETDGSFSQDALKVVYRQAGKKQATMINFPDYDVQADGKSISIISLRPGAGSKQIHVVRNWLEEITELQPTD